MKKVLAYCPVISDGTSWYRGAGPLNALRRQFSNKIQVHYTDARAEWFHLTGADMVFMQRPCTEEHLRFATMVKNANLPLWIDYDDLVTGLTPENSLYGFYEKCKPTVPKIVELADAISVATATLVPAFASKKVTPVVIPNAWNDWLIPQLRGQRSEVGSQRPEDRNPTSAVRHPPSVLWRGCVGHVKDLHDVRDEILALADKHIEWSWTFAGWRPWFFESNVQSPMSKVHQQFNFVNGMGLIEYFHWLPQQNFDVAITPLCDTPFNRAKSNIAWIETTQTGSVMVAPSWDEWKRPGIVRYNPMAGGATTFAETLEAVMAESELTRELRWKQSQDFIFENLLLSKVNKQRMEIIEALTS
jgi:hypothetical protein